MLAAWFAQFSLDALADVGQNQNERPVACIGDALKSHVSRLNKFHCEAGGAKVAQELLAEQNLHVGLIINHENKKIHARSPDLIRDPPARGRTIRNSVNSPGCVSTSIDPPCCLTMMS